MANTKYYFNTTQASWQGEAERYGYKARVSIECNIIEQADELERNARYQNANYKRKEWKYCTITRQQPRNTKLYKYEDFTVLHDSSRF